MSFRRTLPLAPLFLVLALLLAGCGGGPGVPTFDLPTDEEGLARAEADLRAAVAADPRDAGAHRDLARVLAAEGEAAEAADHFNRAVLLDTTLSEGVARDREQAMRIFQARARVQVDAGEWNAVQRELDGADLMHRPDAETVRLRARVSSARGRADEALSLLREAERLDSRNDEVREDLRAALVRAAEARADAGDYERALDAVEEARKRDDRIELVYMEGSIAYAWAQQAPPGLRDAQLERAANAFREVRRRRPGDLDAAFNLGAVLLAGDRYAEAEALYRSLLPENPKDGDLYLALSLVHGHLGETELSEAEKAAGHALRSGEPVDDPRVWADRAVQRYPGSDLEETLDAEGVPDAIHTFNRPGGALVEVWFWWGEDLVQAFQAGRTVGVPVRLARF